MSKAKRLPIFMTGREKSLGFLYLPAGIFLMPSVLLGGNSLLGSPLSAPWLQFLYFSLNFLFVLVIFRDFLQKSLGQTGRNLGPFLICVLAGFLLYWLSTYGVSSAIARVSPDYANLNDRSIAQLAAGNLAVMAFATVLLVPVAEEVLHRGLIFGTLYPKNGAAAYIFSSAIFAAIHLVSYIGVYTPLNLALSFLQYLPAGWILAWAYRTSGSIYAPILIHAAINAVGICALR